MTRKLFLMIAAAMLVVGADDALAQRTAPNTDRAGTAGATYLMVPVTARLASLGAAATGGMADMNGLEALYQNPAGLTTNQGTAAIFSRMSYVADIGINHFGVAQKLGNNQIGLTVTAWDFGDIPLQTEADPEINEDNTWSALFATVGLSYARLFTDRIAAGVTAKYVSERIDNLNAGTIAFDAGMTYTVGETGLRFGVSLRNVGGSLTYGGDGLIRTGRFLGNDQEQERVTKLDPQDVELPALLNVGVTYTRPLGNSATVSFLGNFRSNAYVEDQFSGGIEFGVANIFFARGGYQYSADLDDNFYSGWNLGAGLNLEVSGRRLNIDYAYRGTDYFDGVNIITAAVTL